MSFSAWTSYFQSNRNHVDGLSWDDPYRLSDFEKRVMQQSLQQFQNGESSEGRHLYQRAKQLGDPDYVAAMRLFIKEEQDHARVLGRFMDQQEIPKLRSHWLDTIFQRLRQAVNLEHTIRVLLTAEIIAAVYYQALLQSTYSGLLQQICRRILRDEEMHINFQCFTLRHLTARRGRVASWFVRQGHRLLMAGTTVLVGLLYRRALRAGGFNLLAFAETVWDEYLRAEQMMQPQGLILIRGQQEPAKPKTSGWQWPELRLQATSR